MVGLLVVNSCGHGRINGEMNRSPSLNLRHLNSTVQDLVSYKEDQVSFSRTALNNLLQLKERFTSLDEEFEKLNYGITSKLTLQYHFSFLTEAFKTKSSSVFLVYMPL